MAHSGRTGDWRSALGPLTSGPHRRFTLTLRWTPQSAASDLLRVRQKEDVSGGWYPTALRPFSGSTAGVSDRCTGPRPNNPSAFVSSSPFCFLSAVMCLCASHYLCKLAATFASFKTLQLTGQNVVSFRQQLKLKPKLRGQENSLLFFLTPPSMQMLESNNWLSTSGWWLKVDHLFVPPPPPCRPPRCC